MQDDTGRIDDGSKHRLIGSNRVRGSAHDSVDHRVAIAGLRVVSRKNRGTQLRLRALQSDFEVAAAEARQRGESLCGAQAFVDRRKCSNRGRARVCMCVTSFSRVFRHGG